MSHYDKHERPSDFRCSPSNTLRARRSNTVLRNSCATVAPHRWRTSSGRAAVTDADVATAPSPSPTISQQLLHGAVGQAPRGGGADARQPAQSVTREGGRETRSRSPRAPRRCPPHRRARVANTTPRRSAAGSSATDASAAASAAERARRDSAAAAALPPPPRPPDAACGGAADVIARRRVARAHSRQQRGHGPGNRNSGGRRAAARHQRRWGNTWATRTSQRCGGGPRHERRQRARQPLRGGERRRARGHVLSVVVVGRRKGRRLRRAAPRCRRRRRCCTPAGRHRLPSSARIPRRHAEALHSGPLEPCRTRATRPPAVHRGPRPTPPRVSAPAVTSLFVVLVADPCSREGAVAGTAPKRCWRESSGAGQLG